MPLRAFDRCDDQARSIWHASPPGSPIQLAALPPTHVALTGKHVQDAIACRGHDMEREVDAEQPGDVVHFLLQLAMVSVARVTIVLAEASLRTLVGEFR